MWSQDRHHDVGAYALGVLDEVDSFHFEDHVRGCPQCAVQVTEFRPAARQLMLYRNATPRAVHPFAAPGPRMLGRLLDEVTARHRAKRRRWLFALAASVVIAVGGPTVAVLAGPGEAPDTVAATDSKTGVWAEVKVQDRIWGSDIELKVKEADGAHACRLVVIGKDGSEETAANWKSPEGADKASEMMGGTAMQREDISHFEVRSQEGELLATLKAPAWR
ncbi:hypothetical protein OG920_38450 [Streptomyces europaeiscabiei]|uniref:hypothetical protein n=1 Tax=Streptomyces TaxID=1883 RepID=UPI000A39DD41|nr:MULTISPECIES: hypothetical protein [Streptomyces]MDX3586760.1 hypothetical protein [Streptomyces europaeiscabiei]MDX3618412.1 hypothetical protein [Streptomyces europaeiscabiei]MDX3632011.1 hypothetical protein [Streptomyces europaeiscabiei]MDX3649895.1 hypothetical protein [Streptomyces europaeiscabiei]WUD36868.1 hypothetical protein OG858_39195 [Streptomyces europaeiscabiei]